MDGFVLKKKSYFKMLGLTFSSKLEGSHIIGSFHGSSSNGCQVINFKFLQTFTIDIIYWEEKFLKIWKSNLFSLKIYGIFVTFLCNFGCKIKTSWKFHHQLWLMYSIQCSQFLRIFSRLDWVHGKVNCKVSGKSIKQ